MEAKGGTGKTFCISTIISKLRGLGQIVLVMAVSAQAATLLDGGRTAHSKLKIPIKLDDTKQCNFKDKSVTAKLVKEAALLIIGNNFGRGTKSLYYTNDNNYLAMKKFDKYQ